jgi:hypothetical protein
VSGIEILEVFSLELDMFQRGECGKLRETEEGDGRVEKGCIAGGACGLPWILMRNLRDSIEVKERRTIGIVAG